MLRAYLELLRPANVTTALADVLAGFAVAGLLNQAALPWLLLATACLYGVFDREVDRLERPERPIPSGRVSTARAATFGGALLLAGVVSAGAATAAALMIAVAIAGCVLLYDAWGKQHGTIAPLNMAMCRALNLMLGVAAVPAALAAAWPLALIPLLYIYAITALSRGEVHGGTRRVATVALILLMIAIGALGFVASTAGAPVWPGLALTAALTWRVIPPFWNARQHGTPAAIRAAVKRGVLSLVLLDAAIGASYAGPVYAAIILLTGLAAGWLARMFAVT
jgi:4-hydroxybenzoate polyprenyltransferase